MEHRVWLDEESNRVVKITHPGMYGNTMRFRWTRNATPEQALFLGPATPLEYLDRMALHNRLFGRSVRVIGGVPSNAGPQLVISQIFLRGTSPSQLVIDDYLRAQGFLRIKGVKGYFRREDSIALFDAHQRNFVLTENVPVPFDLITIHVTDPAFHAALDYWT